MRRRNLIIGIFSLCSVLGKAQDMVVYGVIRDLPNRALIAGATVSVEDSLLVPLDRWVTGDSGDYEFYLQMDQLYTLRCSAPGYLPKHVVIDTRNVDASDEEREGGWGMNIDMSLSRAFEGVDTALLKIPFGYAAWSSADTMFAWDMAHTEKIRAQWAAILPAEDADVSKAYLPIPVPADQPPSWARFALVIGLVLLGRWGFALLFGRMADQVGAQQRMLMVMLVGAVVLGVIGLKLWSGAGWEHVFAFGAAAASLGLVAAVVKYSGPVLDHRLSDGMPIAAEERASGQKVLKLMSWSSYVLAIICGVFLFAVMDRTLQGEVHLLHNMGWATVIAVALFLLLQRLARRWFVHPADRMRFWLVLSGSLLFLVPTAVQLFDRMLVDSASVSRIAEIVEMNEVSGRRGRRTYHTIVLVDGVPKDIVMDKEEWDELTYTDALSLTIQRGPTGIDHITGWDPIFRGEEGGGE